MDLRETHDPLEWQPGDLFLDSHVVESLLGEGGMGRVYKVYHRGWQRSLAVKRPLATLLKSPKHVELFESECENWVRLNVHPYVATCYYIRRLQEFPLIFAEFMEKGTLQQFIRSNKLYEGDPKTTLRSILDIAIQMAWGLHFAHASGLVHQDVKPANILLTRNNTVKVTDFGLAKFAAKVDFPVKRPRDPLVSTSGMTPAYCSPEQAARDGLTAKTDMWSWAVSVLQMFTKQVTWISGVAAPHVLTEIVKSPARGRVALPPAIADVLRRCLRDDLGKRPSSMLSVADELKLLYFECTGEFYWREDPPFRVDPGEQIHVVNLNNKAISMIELGNASEAFATFGEARMHATSLENLEPSPELQDIAYNHLLLQIRTNPGFDVTEAPRLVPAIPDAAKHAFLSGLLLLEGGETERAVSFLSIVVEKGGPLYVEAMHARAVALALSGETQPAILALVHALRCAPHRLDIERNLAIAYYYHGSLFRAIAMMRKLAAQGVFDPSDHLRYATFLAAAGSRKEAGRHVDLALSSQNRSSQNVLTAAELTAGSQEFLGRIVRVPSNAAPNALCKKVVSSEPDNLRAAVDAERRLSRTRVAPRSIALWEKNDSDRSRTPSAVWGLVQGMQRGRPSRFRFGVIPKSGLRGVLQAIAAFPVFLVIPLVWFPLLNTTVRTETFGDAAGATTLSVPLMMLVVVVSMLLRRVPDASLSTGLFRLCVFLPALLLLPTWFHYVLAQNLPAGETQVRLTLVDYTRLFLAGLAAVYLARELLFRAVTSYARAMVFPLSRGASRGGITSSSGESAIPRSASPKGPSTLFASLRFWNTLLLAWVLSTVERWIPQIHVEWERNRRNFGLWQLLLLPEFVVLAVSDTLWLAETETRHWLAYGAAMLVTHGCVLMLVSLVSTAFLKLNFLLGAFVALGFATELFDGRVIAQTSVWLVLTIVFAVLNWLSILYCPAFGAPHRAVPRDRWNIDTAIDPLNLKQYAVPWRLIDP